MFPIGKGYKLIGETRKPAFEYALRHTDRLGVVVYITRVIRDFVLFFILYTCTRSCRAATATTNPENMGGRAVSTSGSDTFTATITRERNIRTP
jgi:hypothetical protein